MTIFSSTSISHMAWSWHSGVKLSLFCNLRSNYTYYKCSKWHQKLYWKIHRHSTSQQVSPLRPCIIWVRVDCRFIRRGSLWSTLTRTLISAMWRQTAEWPFATTATHCTRYYQIRSGHKPERYCQRRSVHRFKCSVISFVECSFYNIFYL